MHGKSPEQPFFGITAQSFLYGTLLRRLI